MAQAEAAQLIEPLLDLVEQLSERLLLTELRLGRVLKAQFGRRSEHLDPSQLQLALAWSGLRAAGSPSAADARAAQSGDPAAVA